MSHYVYRFLDFKGDVLYVGETGELEKRIKSHFSAKGSNLCEECYIKTRKVEYIYFVNKADALSFEIYYMNKVQAIYNKKDNVGVVPTANKYFDEIAENWKECEIFDSLRKEMFTDNETIEKMTFIEWEEIKRRLILSYSVEELKKIVNDVKKEQELKRRIDNFRIVDYIENIFPIIYEQMKDRAKNGSSEITWRYASKNSECWFWTDQMIKIKQEKIPDIDKNAIVFKLVEVLKEIGFNAKLDINSSSNYLRVNWQ